MSHKRDPSCWSSDSQSSKALSSVQSLEVSAGVISHYDRDLSNVVGVSPASGGTASVSPGSKL